MPTAWITLARMDFTSVTNLCRRGILVVAASLVTGDALAGDPSLHRYSFSEIHMGAPWKITFYADSPEVANHAAERVFARVEQLNQILSDYDRQSELSRLSTTGPSPQPVHVSDDLWAVLSRSQQLAIQSGGGFDVTVGPLTQLWRRARREKELPDPEVLGAAREATDFRALRLDPAAQTAQLLKPQMRLDVGGIGMGYAVDEALKLLRAEGITSALIDASGDIGASDPPPGQCRWRIGIAPLRGTGPPSRYVELANNAVTTSGDAFQSVQIGDKHYSHIVDPHTGLGLTDHTAVTVIASDCITADGVATAVCVLGPTAGLKLIESTPGAAALIFRQVASDATDDKIETFESPNFADHVIP